MAGFLSLQAPTKAMQAEAAKAELFNYDYISYPGLKTVTGGQIS